MAWLQSNDKHIYAKNCIDDRHIYVSMNLNELTLSLEITNEGYIGCFFYFNVKYQCQKTEKMGVNSFHPATKY